MFLPVDILTCYYSVLYFINLELLMSTALKVLFIVYIRFVKHI